MPAWQTILIPASAAPVAAALAVTAYRTRAAAARDHNRHLKHVPGGHTRPHAN
jgi:hypothetical protein